METHKATIERKDTTSAILKLLVGTVTLDISLTEDNPNDVKSVFNELILHLKNGQFEFELTDTEEDLYTHICKEYIKQLNIELASIYEALKYNELLS